MTAHVRFSVAILACGATIFEKEIVALVEQRGSLTDLSEDVRKNWDVF
jgi:hypothetical protein